MQERPNVFQWAYAECLMIAQRSQDPSTKVGAIILRPDYTVVSKGYNGFPRGVRDHKSRYEERNIKYAMVVHAEMNAILTAREPLNGYTLISSCCVCMNCAKHAIQAGIKRIVCPTNDAYELYSRWGQDWGLCQDMLSEAGVTLSTLTKYQISWANTLFSPPPSDPTNGPGPIEELKYISPPDDIPF